MWVDSSLGTCLWLCLLFTPRWLCKDVRLIVLAACECLCVEALHCCYKPCLVCATANIASTADLQAHLAFGCCETLLSRCMFLVIQAGHCFWSCSMHSMTHAIMFSGVTLRKLRVREGGYGAMLSLRPDTRLQ